MMLLERWVVAGVLGVCMTSALSPAQPPGKPAKLQKVVPAAKAAPAEKVVQPDSGPPPDQAVQPDQTAPLAPVLVPDPPPLPADEWPQPAPEPEQVDQVPGPAPAPTLDQNAEQPAAQSSAEEADQATVKGNQPAQAEPSRKAAAPASIPAVASVAEEPMPANATPEERQLRNDAAHLLQLVQELKVEVEKAGTNTLSITALRKADEVQRLSKSLKERMKGWSQTAQNR